MTASLLTVSDVCQITRLSEETVRKLAREGKLPFIRLGKSLRVKASDLDRFLTSQAGSAPTTATA